jgi:hypothetical protein
LISAKRRAYLAVHLLLEIKDLALMLQHLDRMLLLVHVGRPPEGVTVLVLARTSTITGPRTLIARLLGRKTTLVVTVERSTQVLHVPLHLFQRVQLLLVGLAQLVQFTLSVLGVVNVRHGLVVDLLSLPLELSILLLETVNDVVSLVKFGLQIF